MVEQTAFENSQISNFEGLVTSILTLDRVILHTVINHSSTSTYKPHFVEIEETFCGLTDVHTDGRTMQSSKSRDTKTRTNFKNPARPNLDIVP